MKREYQQAICLPLDLVKAKSLAGSKCEHDWRNQRKNNDWQGFLKNFREVVKTCSRGSTGPNQFASGRFPTPYDAMLDLYCTGDKGNGFIADVFTRLKGILPGTVQQVVEKQKGDSVLIFVVIILSTNSDIASLHLDLMKCWGLILPRGTVGCQLPSI